MDCVCSRDKACSDWLILGHCSPVMPTGRLGGCKKQSKKPYNQQVINLEHSVFTGKSQTLAKSWSKIFIRIKKGCITHLCLNHGCSSCSQVSNKVENIDCTFRLYPVERAIDNHECTCPANSST